MAYNPLKHHRRSIRLKGYDYSQKGLYFLTICSQNMECRFGKIVYGKMQLNEIGIIVQDEWIKSDKIRKEIKMHEYIVMPNHFHGIVEIVAPIDRDANAPINNNAGANGRSPVTFGDLNAESNSIPCPHMHSKSISSLVSGFKSAVTTKVNQLRCTPGVKLWHRNYWEHIIRNEDEYLRISEYIHKNPIKWYFDKLCGGKGNSVLEASPIYGQDERML